MQTPSPAAPPASEPSASEPDAAEEGADSFNPISALVRFLTIRLISLCACLQVQSVNGHKEDTAFRVHPKSPKLGVFALGQNAAGIVVAGSLGGLLYLQKQEAAGFEEEIR